ncbi:hypothetical protein PoB_006947400 [Plakobranchus ocellatus]|uniref:Uncharacterized protein n=1 Tax=Plakobranchus ocellatus TaxID=259542 RepID=A0AAV4DFM3_9GAST|nr:hypothetical protein PoB_006947400 [Plakobranchus ocellatus]
MDAVRTLNCDLLLVLVPDSSQQPRLSPEVLPQAVSCSASPKFSSSPHLLYESRHFVQLGSLKVKSSISALKLAALPSFIYPPLSRP